MLVHCRFQQLLGLAAVARNIDLYGGSLIDRAFNPYMGGWQVSIAIALLNQPEKIVIIPGSGGHFGNDLLSEYVERVLWDT